MSKLYDWDKVKADYVEHSLKAVKTPTAYFTNKYGMKYHTFMSKKKTQNWDKEVKRQRAKLSTQTLKKVRTGLSTIDAEDVLDEIKVRKKNMEIANKLLGLLDEEWIIKIKDPKQRKSLTLTGLMTGYEAVSRMRGKAAGLPDKLDINSKNMHVHVDANSDHLSPSENRKKLQESEELAKELQGLIKEFKDEAIDVESVKPKKSKASKLLGE